MYHIILIAAIFLHVSLYIAFMKAIKLTNPMERTEYSFAHQCVIKIANEKFSQ